MCLQNILVGEFPEVIVKAHEQYLAGEKAANNSETSMCPIGNNAAFCAGWDNNNDDYGDWDCGDAYDNYTGPFSSNLVGCPLDTLKVSQMAALPILVGNWHYVKPSLGSTISGKIVYGANGDVKMTLIIALPVAPKDTVKLLNKEADLVEVVTSPSSHFYGIGEYYQYSQ